MTLFIQNLPATRLKNRSHSHQRGAILPVSLLVLLIMSLAAAASAQKSVLGERMAANTQNNYRTFHAAETAIADTINNTNLLRTAVVRGFQPDEPAHRDITLPQGSAMSASAEMHYIEAFPNVDNYSLGNSLGGIRFTVNGRSALLHNDKIRSKNTQGFYRIVPAS